MPAEEQLPRPEWWQAGSCPSNRVLGMPQAMTRSDRLPLIGLDVGRLAAGIQSTEKFASWLPWEFFSAELKTQPGRQETPLRLDHALEAISWHRLLFSGAAP